MYQNTFIKYMFWIMGGLLAIGSILDAVSKSIQLLSSETAFILIKIIIVTTIGLSLYVKHFPINTVLKNGQKIIIKSFGLKYYLWISGVILCLTFPIIYNDSKLDTKQIEAINNLTLKIKENPIFLFFAIEKGDTIVDDYWDKFNESDTHYFTSGGFKNLFQIVQDFYVNRDISDYTSPYCVTEKATYIGCDSSLNDSGEMETFLHFEREFDTTKNLTKKRINFNANEYNLFFSNRPLVPGDILRTINDPNLPKSLKDKLSKLNSTLKFEFSSLNKILEQNKNIVIISTKYNSVLPYGKEFEPHVRLFYDKDFKSLEDFLIFCKDMFTELTEIERKYDLHLNLFDPAYIENIEKFIRE